MHLMGLVILTVSDSAATDYKRFEFPAGSGQWQSGRREEYLGKKSNTLAEFYLNYVKDLKSIDSRVDIMAGTSYQDFKTTNYSFANYALNGTMDPNSKPIFEKDIPQNRLLSYYGRLNYGYKSRYLLTAVSVQMALPVFHRKTAGVFSFCSFCMEGKR
jgi:hypothetical protein